MKKKIDAVLEKILIALLCLMLLSVCWQVFTRFILKNPSTLTDEISSYALIWLGLLGASYATGKKLHLAIDLLPSLLVEKHRNWFDGFILIAVFGFSFLVLVIGGIRLCWLSFLFDQKSAAMQLSLGYVYLVIPLSGILNCSYLFYSFSNKT